MGLIVGIAGITGRLGSRLAKHLLRDPSVFILGYCRDPSKVDNGILAEGSARIVIHKGDALDAAKLATFVSPCHVVVGAYYGDNAFMVDAQKLLIDLCESRGVPRYVAGDWSLDYTRLGLGELPPKDPMKTVKEYIESKEKVRGVHVLTGVFMEILFSPFFGAYDADAKTIKYWGDGTELIETTTYDNAAEYTANIIKDPSAVGIQRSKSDEMEWNGMEERMLLN